MSYKDLPLIPIDIVRGNTKQVRFQDFTVDDVPLDLTTACIKVQFKTSVDAKRYVDFELTEENEGLDIEPDHVTMNFGRETFRLNLNKYYGDLLAKINDQDVTLLRFEINLTGVVTTKKESNEC